MSLSHPSLVVAPASSDTDVQCACDIMVEAADWLIASNQPLWNPENLVPDKIRPSPENGSLLLARLAGQPVGAYVLLFEDPLFCPNASPGEALYLHKLAVRRCVARIGLGRSLLDDAVARARAHRPLLRLDCAPRPKLCAFYESAGSCIIPMGPSVSSLFGDINDRP